MFEFFDQDGRQLVIPDDEYQGVFSPLPVDVSTDLWEEKDFLRQSHLDWVASACVEHVIPVQFRYLRPAIIESMRLHEQVYQWFANHPTPIEERNARMVGTQQKPPER